MSPCSRVLPASAAITSSRSPRRSAIALPTLRRISARSWPESLPHALPASSVSLISFSASASLVSSLALRVSMPSLVVLERSRIARPHSRLPASAGSVSGVFSKRPAGTKTLSSFSVRRFWVRLDAGTSSVTEFSARMKRSSSRLKMDSSVARSKIPDMKFSEEAFSSRRRIRYAIATSNSLGFTTGTYSSR